MMSLNRVSVISGKVSVISGKLAPYNTGVCIGDRLARISVVGLFSKS